MPFCHSLPFYRGTSRLSGSLALLLLFFGGRLIDEKKISLEGGRVPWYWGCENDYERYRLEYLEFPCHVRTDRYDMIVGKLVMYGLSLVNYIHLNCWSDDWTDNWTDDWPEDWTDNVRPIMITLPGWCLILLFCIQPVWSACSYSAYSVHMCAVLALDKLRKAALLPTCHQWHVWFQIWHSEFANGDGTACDRQRQRGPWNQVQ